MICKHCGNLLIMGRVQRHAIDFTGIYRVRSITACRIALEYKLSFLILTINLNDSVNIMLGCNLVNWNVVGC